MAFSLFPVFEDSFLGDMCFSSPRGRAAKRRHPAVLPPPDMWIAYSPCSVGEGDHRRHPMSLLLQQHPTKVPRRSHSAVASRSSSNNADDHDSSSNNNGKEAPFNASVNFSGFRPQDVKVSVDHSNRSVTVRADVASEDATGMFVRKSMRQTVQVPRGFDLEGLRAAVEEKGAQGNVMKLQVPRIATASLKHKNISEEEDDSTRQEETKVGPEKSSGKEDSSPPAEEDVVSKTEEKGDVAEKENVVHMEDLGEDTESDAHDTVVKDKIEVPVKIVGLHDEEDKEKEQQQQKEQHQEQLEQEPVLPPFKTTVDVRGFPVSSLTVEVTDRDFVRVKGMVEEIDAEDGSQSTRQFSRTVPVLPRGAYDLGNLSYEVSEDGNTLTLKAHPKKQQQQ